MKDFYSRINWLQKKLEERQIDYRQHSVGGEGDESELFTFYKPRVSIDIFRIGDDKYILAFPVGETEYIYAYAEGAPQSPEKMMDDLGAILRDDLTRFYDAEEYAEIERQIH